MSRTPTLDIPVLIVGGGPIGLFSSILLSRLGIAHEIIERRKELHRAPQAHVVSSRSLELFRAAGLDAAALAAIATSAKDTRAIRYVNTLAGPELGRMDLASAEMLARILAATPCPPTNISQHKLEPLLCEAASKAGAEVRFGEAWESMETDAEGVTSTICMPDGTLRWVRSRYLLACDGAGSRVRNALGIELIGPAEVQRFAMVDVAANLRAVVGDRPALLYWNLDPAEPGVFIAHDIDERWVCMMMLAPGERAPSKDEARAAVASRIGCDADFEILGVDEWVMTAQVAERYQEGRVMLIGDAAHRFPPTGGLGMNTGLADAFNLAWKLAAVLDDRAHPALLESYDSERRAIAQANTDQSLANFAQTGKILAALGLRPEDDVLAQRRWIRSLPDDPKRQARLNRAIEADARHYDPLDLDLGTRYTSGAVIHDDSPEPSGPEGVYVATTRPGARLPHAWLERDGERISTLDLVPRDRPLLLLGREGRAWETPVKTLGLDAVAVDGKTLVDPEGLWATLREVDEDGALLIRPDHHIAFRAASTPEDPTSVLRHALEIGLHFRPEETP